MEIKTKTCHSSQQTTAACVASCQTKTTAKISEVKTPSKVVQIYPCPFFYVNR